MVPWGLRCLVNWITKTFPGVDIYITENGTPDDGRLNDTARADYYNEILNELLKGGSCAFYCAALNDELENQSL
jgi:beta-glucosidase/6-phospho-beta-glucosidase/beta-galactosidase